MADHSCPVETHTRWDASLQPSLEIQSGDAVSYRLADVSDGQLGPDSAAEDLTRMDVRRLYPLAGPLYVQGAQPGDTLEVEVLELRPGTWGWTGIIPGDGLLSEFDQPYLYIWQLEAGRPAHFKDIAEITLGPFCGTMGVCPPPGREAPIHVPDRFGGNLDCRGLVEGARLYLPVLVPGALFSVGDAHAAQGDGEVCISAIECPMQTRLRFTLHRGRTIPGPQYFEPARPHGPEAGPRYVTTGIGPDLMEAARDAVRAMIDHMSRTYGMDPKDAYLLASIAVDLKIAELVNLPHVVVSAHLPLSIFR